MGAVVALVFSILAPFGEPLAPDGVRIVQSLPGPLLLDLSANAPSVDTAIKVVLACTLSLPSSANAGQSSGVNPLPFVILSLAPCPSLLTKSILWLVLTSSRPELALLSVISRELLLPEVGESLCSAVLVVVLAPVSSVLDWSANSGLMEAESISGSLHSDPSPLEALLSTNVPLGSALPLIPSGLAVLLPVSVTASAEWDQLLWNPPLPG